MKRKMLFSIMVLMLFCCSNVYCDEIELTNGSVFEGNIILEDGKRVVIDLVQNNLLIGARITLEKNEIKKIVKDDNYLNAIKKELTQKEKVTNLIQLKKRTNINGDIDKIILERVKRERDRFREIELMQEDKRRFEKELQHEKEMEILKGQIQLELLNASGSNTDVLLINGN